MVQWAFPVLASCLAAHSANAFLIPRDHAPGITTIPLKVLANQQQYTASVRMGPDGSGQQFNFGLSTTLGYTVVAGKSCDTCVDSSAPKYDQSLSSTFSNRPSNSTNTTSTTASVSIGSKNFTGPLGVERCALGTDTSGWWVYENQTVIVAGQGTGAGAFGSGNISGIAGFGQSAVQNPSDSLVGQFFKAREGKNVTSLAFGVSLNPPTGDGSDSDGGAIHLFGADPEFYQGNISTVGVASPQQQQSFGPVPPELGSFDWSAQMEGWSFQHNGAGSTGGRNIFATVEPAFPYIMLTQADVIRIYAAIPGATTEPSVKDSITFKVPCDIVKDFSFTVQIAGLTIPVDPKDLATQVGDTCYGSIRGWPDTNRNTYILGSAFIRNTYLLYTAEKDSQMNTIGFASRLHKNPGGNKASAGVIAGSVVGGLVFVGLLAVGVWLWMRRRRQSEPSGGVSPTHNEKSFFGFKNPKDNDQNLVAEPWMPPQATSGSGEVQVYRDPRNGDQLTVGPWVDPGVVDGALLAPDSRGLATAAVVPPPTSAHSHTHLLPGRSTPPGSGTSHSPVSTVFPSPPGSPGYYDPPMRGLRDSYQGAHSYQPLSTNDPAPYAGATASAMGPGGQPMWSEKR